MSCMSVVKVTSSLQAQFIQYFNSCFQRFFVLIQNNRFVTAMTFINEWRHALHFLKLVACMYRRTVFSKTLNRLMNAVSSFHVYVRFKNDVVAFWIIIWMSNSLRIRERVRIINERRWAEVDNINWTLKWRRENGKWNLNVRSRPRAAGLRIQKTWSWGGHSQTYWNWTATMLEAGRIGVSLDYTLLNEWRKLEKPLTKTLFSHILL